MAKNKRKTWQREEHPDYAWIRSKINGHGARIYYSIFIDGLAQITYIYGIPWYKIGWYNLILLYRCMRRKVKK